jgi:hypothetical protein
VQRAPRNASHRNAELFAGFAELFAGLRQIGFAILVP